MRTKSSSAAPKRAALYPRVSDPNGERDGTSLDTQEKAMRAYARERGYTVAEAHVFRETHTGVELWQRPKLTALREVVRRREVDVVVAYAIDRLSRDPVHLGVIISEAEHAGVEVVFVTEPLDNSPEGQLIRYVRGYAAKVEHEKIKERTLRGKKDRAEKGKLLPGWKPLYGYTRVHLPVPDDADERARSKARSVAYAIDPETAGVVRRIYAEALSGRTVRAIAVGLTADGVRRPSGPNKAGEDATRWGERTVWLKLTDPAYTGDAAAGRSARLISAVALPAGTIPPIIDPETFAAVQARLTGNKRGAARNNRDPEASLLRGGYARCGECGWTMHVYRPSRRGQTLLVYRCSRGQKPGYAGKCQQAISVHLLDAKAWARVETLLQRPEQIADHLARLQRNDPSAADLAAVERTLAGVAKKQANLVENLTNVTGDAAALLTEKLNALVADKARLEAEREGILSRREGWRLAQEQVGDIEAWCRRTAANLPHLTYQDRRQALDVFSLVAKVWRKDHTPRVAIYTRVPVDVPSGEAQEGDGATVCTTGASSTRNHGIELIWTDADDSVAPQLAEAVGGAA